MSKLKSDVIAIVICIFIIVVFHVLYDAAIRLTVRNDMGFYVAFIGGGVTFFIYENISKNNKRE